jgi:hypothetical protein
MPPQPLLHFGPYRLDLASGQLWRHDQVLDLPPRALAVLGPLVAHAGQLVTKEALLAAGWPDTAVGAYVAHHFPGPLAHVIGPVMYQRRAGHPLFMVHLAAYLAQQVTLDTSASEALVTRMAAAVDVIPAGMQHLIELQLGRLSKDEQRVLETASLVGVEFAVASVAAALHVSAERAETVCAALAQHGLFLETSGLMVWPDGPLNEGVSL